MGLRGFSEISSSVQCAALLPTSDTLQKIGMPGGTFSAPLVSLWPWAFFCPHHGRRPVSLWPWAFFLHRHGRHPWPFVFHCGLGRFSALVMDVIWFHLLGSFSAKLRTRHGPFIF